MTYHFVCRAEGWQHSDSHTWGPCRRWIEVADDQCASRQIDVYESGPVLVYDRRCPRDAYGMLIGLRFSSKDKWRSYFSGVRLLQPAEFEAAWREFAPQAMQHAAAVRIPDASQR